MTANNLRNEAGMCGENYACLTRIVDDEGELEIVCAQDVLQRIESKIQHIPCADRRLLAYARLEVAVSDWRRNTSLPHASWNSRTQ